MDDLEDILGPPQRIRDVIWDGIVLLGVGSAFIVGVPLLLILVAIIY